MKVYTILTFRSKNDAILTRECFDKLGLKSCLSNAPEGISSPCAWVLNVGNMPVQNLLCALAKCRKHAESGYRIYELDGGYKFQKIL